MIIPGESCIAGALSWSAFLRFVQSMQRFVPRALFKMAAPFDILSILPGGNGYGRNRYGPKWFWAKNEQMASDTFIFLVCLGIRVPQTQNRRLKNEDAIFVCLNFYATVCCKKALSERQLQGMPRSTARRFFEAYRCVGKRCKTFRSAPLMQRTPELTKIPERLFGLLAFIRKYGKIIMIAVVRGPTSARFAGTYFYSVRFKPGTSD